MTAAPLLAVEDLKTWFFGRQGVAKAVNGVSFTLNEGEILGMPAEQLRRLRGNRISMVFQDPMMTLNPVLRIDTQMIEALRAHRSISRIESRRAALDALDRVGIPAPEQRLRSYPHQLSGGMRQRVAIAIALLNRPDIVIADEPTTALDVTIQAQILHEVRNLCRDSGAALLWITHDLAVLAGLADRIAVMYAGRIVESGPVDAILQRPLHPYTAGLIESLPRRGQRGRRLIQIPGMAPSLSDIPPGCPFMPRCHRAIDRCRSEVDVSCPESDRTLRCVNPLA